jgi:hypothetical protein
MRNYKAAPGGQERNPDGRATGSSPRTGVAKSSRLRVCVIVAHRDSFHIGAKLRHRKSLTRLLSTK